MPSFKISASRFTTSFVMLALSHSISAQSQTQNNLNINVNVRSPYTYLDWQPAANACGGRYVEPVDGTVVPSDLPLRDQPINASADYSNANLDSGNLRLEGGVRIQQGARVFSTDRIDFDNSQRNALLLGDVKIRDKGVLLLGEEASTNFDTGESNLRNLEFVMHDLHLRGNAESAVHFQNNQLQMNRGQFSFCPPGTNAWSIDSGQITLYPDKGFGVSTNTLLRVGDVPVFYFPWFSFPIDDVRRTGFLYPEPRYSERSGFEMNVPYYFNLAPNMDNTLNLKFLSERGFMFENEFRHMNRWSESDFNVAYVVNDTVIDESRWIMGFNQEGRTEEGVTTLIDFAEAGDDDYLSDFDSFVNSRRANHLNQRVQVGYEADQWSVFGNFHDYQTLNQNVASPYARAPQLLFTSDFSFNTDSFLRSNAEYVNFQRKRQDFFEVGDLRRTEATRLHLDATLGHEFSRSWGYIRPEVGFWYSGYDFNFPSNVPAPVEVVAEPVEEELTDFDIAEESQTDPEASDNDNEIAPDTSTENDSIAAATIAEQSSLPPDAVTATVARIDGGLYFDRFFSMDGQNYSQSIEPRIMFLQVNKNENQPTPSDFAYFDSSLLTFNYDNLFSSYGWSGYDRIASTSQITLGAESIMRDDSGRQILKLAAAQARYFNRDDENDLRPGDFSGDQSSSNIALLANWNVTPAFELGYDAQISEDGFAFESQDFRASWQANNNAFYFNYRDARFRNSSREPTSQTDIAFHSYLTPEWSVLGRWRQDMENSQRLESVLGVEYGACCWKVRLTTREWLRSSNAAGSETDYDRDISLQFVLRGLGAFGRERIRSSFEQLPGFRDINNADF